MLCIFIPVPPFNCFLYLSCYPACTDALPIYHPKNELHRYLHLIIPPITVLDCMSTWTRVHSLRPPPPISMITAFTLLTFYPGSCWPLQPCTVRPFLMPHPRYGRPHFTALGMIQAPLSTPCDFALLGSVLLPQLLEPLSPPSDLDLQPSS